jgi:TonB family protein
MDELKLAAALMRSAWLGVARRYPVSTQGKADASYKRKAEHASSPDVVSASESSAAFRSLSTGVAGMKGCTRGATPWGKAAISIHRAAVLASCLLLAACATTPHSPVLTPPVLEKAMTPVYPPASMAANNVGLVLLKIDVRADGKVSDVGLVKRAPFVELEQAAEFPAYFWRFRPATSDGVPIAGTVRIPVSFLRSSDGDLVVVICQELPPSAPDSETTACPTPSRAEHPHASNALATQGSGVVAPKIASRTPLAYPPEAIRDRHEGTAVLLILVDTSGKPLDVKLSHSSGFRELDVAAIQAASQWSFIPQTVNGVPRQGYVRVPVNFSLNYIDGPIDHLPDEVPGGIQGALAGASKKSADVFNVEFFDGTLFTGWLVDSRLAASHQEAFRRRTDESIPPATPAAAGTYAASLEKAYGLAYAEAMRGNGLSYASRCMEECELSLALDFIDGGSAWVNMQQNAAEIRLLALGGLPTAADVQVLARVVALLRNHPGWQPNNDSLRALAGPTAKFAMLYYYDVPLRFVPGEKMLASPPPPPPPPSLSNVDSSSLNACKLTDQGSQTPQTTSSIERRAVEVTMVIGRGGHVEHEWITHSSGSRSQDVAALDKAAGWMFEGQGCSHQRVSKLVVVAAQAD